MFHFKSRVISNDFDEYADYASRYGLKGNKKTKSKSRCNNRAVSAHKRSIDFSPIAKLRIDFDKNGNYDSRKICQDLNAEYEKLTKDDFVTLSAYVFANRISRGKTFTLERI